MMGRQIAQVFAQHGHEVEATDEDLQALKAGLNEIADGPYGLHAAVSKGKLTPEQANRALASIKTSPTLDNVCKDSNLVIEAAFEDLRLKQNLFQRIESTAPSTAIIASNTSTLSLDKITQKISKKDRTIGMHFFNPAQLTKMEASKLLEDGVANLSDIDACMRLGYNHPMGPFELADFVGLDTRLRNLESLYKSTNESRWIPPKLLREMVQQGYLGDPARKKASNGGYYEYLKIKR
ncbi:3-hydroxyacyl-CoA dehydrogenase family protein [Candidatus Bathyarchaeota archaeon]|nr:MAG: 3-hydroxyacyl-CoA dehydrogenase family protein [Candidatus Bathyarchaeota archaeon]